MDAEVSDWDASAVPPHESLTETISQMSQNFKKSSQRVIFLVEEPKLFSL